MPALLTRMSIVGGVGGISFYLDAESGDFFFGLLSVFVDYEVSESYVGAFFGEAQRNLLADAAGGAGYQSGFSFK